jgi:hypothetical protein
MFNDEQDRSISSMVERDEFKKILSKILKPKNILFLYNYFVKQWPEMKNFVSLMAIILTGLLLDEKDRESVVSNQKERNEKDPDNLDQLEEASLESIFSRISKIGNLLDTRMPFDRVLGLIYVLEEFDNSRKTSSTFSSEMLDRYKHKMENEDKARKTGKILDDFDTFRNSFRVDEDGNIKNPIDFREESGSISFKDEIKESLHMTEDDVNALLESLGNFMNDSENEIGNEIDPDSDQQKEGFDDDLF